VALAGLFPFMGYLLVANEGAVAWISLVVDGPPGSDAARALAISRIREIYFALVWLSGGVILLKLFCPKEIALFSSEYEHNRNEILIAEPLRLKEFQDGLNASTWVTAFWSDALHKATKAAKEVRLDDIKIDSPFPDLGEPTKSREDWLSSSGREISLCLNAKYQVANCSWPIIRLISFVAFCVGYIKLAYPAYKVLLGLLAT